MTSCKLTSVKSSINNLVEEDDVGVGIMEHTELGLGQWHGAEVLDPPDEQAGAVGLDDVTKVVFTPSRPRSWPLKVGCEAEAEQDQDCEDGGGHDYYEDALHRDHDTDQSCHSDVWSLEPDLELVTTLTLNCQHAPRE